VVEMNRQVADSLDNIISALENDVDGSRDQHRERHADAG
jgi:hypothetical protein